MANVTLNQHALSDVSCVEIVDTEDNSYVFDTSDEVTIEEVVDEGEEQTLKIKGKLYANRAAEDTVLGYDLTFKDNVMCPELLELMQGGTLTKGGGDAFESYEPPKIGTSATKKSFTTNIYTAEVSTDGDTGKYIKISYPGCKGSSVPMTFKDGEYYTNEYTVKSRPPKGSSPYKVTIVSALPSAQ